MDLRFNIGKCWISMLKLEKDFFLDFYEILFSFFFDNYRVEHYQMNFIASEFFLFVLEEYEENFKNIHKIKTLPIENKKNQDNFEQIDEMINLFESYLKE